MKIKVSTGEIVDKFTILEIKLENVKDSKQRKNIKKEYKYLKKKVKKLRVHVSLINQLKLINSRIWAIEDEIRLCEAEGNFSKEFIDLARAVYFTNDERASVKKKINFVYDSKLVEEKILPEYGNPVNR